MISIYEDGGYYKPQCNQRWIDNKFIKHTLEHPQVLQCASDKPNAKRWGWYVGFQTHYPSRKKECFGGYSALVLDYDGTVTIDAIRSVLDAFVGFGHTSTSHTPNKPRFRVILPLSKPLKFATLGTPGKRYLVDKFGQGTKKLVDPETFAEGRFFIQPSVVRGAEAHYQHWMSTSMVYIDQNPMWARWQLEIAQAIKEYEQHHFDCSALEGQPLTGNLEKIFVSKQLEAKAYVAEQLAAIDWQRGRGHGQNINSTLYKCYGILRKTLLSKQETIAVLTAYATDRQSRQEIQSMCDRDNRVA